MSRTPRARPAPPPEIPILSFDRAFHLMQRGFRLVVQETKHGRKHFIEGAGQVTDEVAQALLEMNNIQAAGDSFSWSKTSQTYVFVATAALR